MHNVLRTLMALVTAVGAAATLAQAQVINLPLDYNFNGMLHAGEPNGPDAPDGYRSISDRGLNIDGGSISFGTGPIVGFDGISYQIETAPGVVDIVHLGNRNTVDSGNRPFDPNANNDDFGMQPAWLTDPDQTGPQVTDLTGGAPIVLDATAELALLYHVSNGGGSFDVTLIFDPNDPNAPGGSVTVTCQAPDWFENQVPGPPGPGLVSQAQLGVYAGLSGTDNPFGSNTLNIAEAVISVPELLADGLGDYAGQTLAAIAFSNRSNTDAGYAIFAATVRTGLAPPANDDCANAIAVGEGSFPGSNARATGSDISSCGTGDTTSVWFEYTPSTTGTAQASTCGGGTLNTTITVYDSCGGGEIACDDNTCGTQSLVTWPAEQGVSYLVRIAGAGAAEGNFTLDLQADVLTFEQTPLPLTYNWNGMVHAGEAGIPDAPNGFRSISDRALNRVNYPGGFLGTTGIAYDVVATPGTLDLVHLGDRNSVGWVFDPNDDGDDVGTQPGWLTDPNQNNPQISDVSAAGVVLSSSSEIGLIYHVSNGGGDFDMELGFSDASSVTVTLNAPDWFGNQSPDPNAGPGVAVQTQMGIFPGTGRVDQGFDDLALNLAEAIVTVEALNDDGVGSVSGKTLTSVTFGNTSTGAGYAIYAVTVRESGTSEPCPGDVDGTGGVDLTDLAIVLANFGCTPPPACTGDADGDDDVDLTDLALVLANFGQSCP